MTTNKPRAEDAGAGLEQINRLETKRPAMNTVPKPKLHKNDVPCPCGRGGMHAGSSECFRCRQDAAYIAMLAKRKLDSEAERSARIETIAYLKHELVLDARAYRNRPTYIPFAGAFAQRDLECLESELEQFDAWVAGTGPRPHRRPYSGEYGRPGRGA